MVREENRVMEDISQWGLQVKSDVKKQRTADSGASGEETGLEKKKTKGKRKENEQKKRILVAFSFLTHFSLSLKTTMRGMGGEGKSEIKRTD